jgi:MFS family permease
MHTPIRRAGALLLILTLLNILNFADRYVMVAFSTAIVPDLGITNFEFGLLTGIVFLLIYMVVGVIAGPLADRHHRPKLISLGLALWSGLTALSGLAHNFWQMALARVFIGVGEASLTPAAVSLIADAYPPSRRALPYGIFYWGIPVGVGGAYIFAGIVGPIIGWRGSFMLLGGIGIVLAALLYFFMREIPRGRFDDPASQVAPENMPSNLRESLVAVWQLGRSNPAFTLTLIGACATTFVQGAGVLDLLWWVKELGYEETKAQQYTGLMFLVGGLIGGVLGGFGGDLARKLTPAGDLKFLAWGLVVAVPMSIVYRYVEPATPLFYALGFSGSILFMFYFGPISSAFQEQIPTHMRGAATGIIVVITTLTSAIGSAVVGYLADMFIASGDDAPLTHAILLCQLVGLISIPCYFVAARMMARREISEFMYVHLEAKDK